MDTVSLLPVWKLKLREVMSMSQSKNVRVSYSRRRNRLTPSLVMPQTLPVRGQGPWNAAIV